MADRLPGDALRCIDSFLDFCTVCRKSCTGSLCTTCRMCETCSTLHLCVVCQQTKCACTFQKCLYCDMITCAGCAEHEELAADDESKCFILSLFIMVYDNQTGEMVDEILLDGPQYTVCGHGGSFDWIQPTSATGSGARTLALWKYTLPESVGDDGAGVWLSLLPSPSEENYEDFLEHSMNQDLYSEENRLPLYQKDGNLYIVTPSWGRTRAEAAEDEDNDGMGKAWVEFGHRVEGDLYSLQQKTPLWDSDWDGYGKSKYATSTSGYLEFMME